MLFLLPLALIALFAVIVLALQRLDNREEPAEEEDWRSDVWMTRTPETQRRFG